MIARNPKNKILLFLLLLAVLVVGWFSFSLAKRHFLFKTADQSQSTLRLAVAGLRGELSRFEPIPALIADNLEIRKLLLSPDDPLQITKVNVLLRKIAANVGASDVYIMDVNGLTVAASNFDTSISFVNRNFNFRPYFQTAIKGGFGRYFALGFTSLKRGYYFAVPVWFEGSIIGVTTVKINIDGFETAWRGNENEIVVSDKHGIIFMSSQTDWLFKSFKPLSNSTLNSIKSSRQYLVANLSPLTFGKSAKLFDDFTMVPVLKENKFTEYLISFMRMEETGWSVHVLSPTNGAKAQAYITFLSITLFLLLAIMLLALIFQRRSRLVERIQSQHEAQQLLEKRVESRTKDLNDANEKLLSEVEERTTTEKRLRKTQNDLIQAGKLAGLGQMSAALSHEFNQPLAAVRTYAENAEAYLERNRYGEVKENLGRISELTDRMAAISKHLRNFARKPKEQVGPVPLAAVINDAIAIMSGKLKLNGADVMVDVPTDALWVKGGQIRLQQVLVNLISNGLDAMSDHTDAPSIEIYALVDDGWINIHVRDFGPGLEVEVLNKIFDPFFTTKGINQGLGLGLSISYNIIQDFGGRLSASNHPDGGAVFMIKLKQENKLLGAAE